MVQLYQQRLVLHRCQRFGEERLGHVPCVGQLSLITLACLMSA